jgi:hypothetical protein
MSSTAELLKQSFVQECASDIVSMSSPHTRVFSPIGAINSPEDEPPCSSVVGVVEARQVPAEMDNCNGKVCIGSVAVSKLEPQETESSAARCRPFDETHMPRKKREGREAIELTAKTELACIPQRAQLLKNLNVPLTSGNNLTSTRYQGIEEEEEDESTCSSFSSTTPFLNEEVFQSGKADSVPKPRRKNRKNAVREQELADFLLRFDFAAGFY